MGRGGAQNVGNSKLCMGTRGELSLSAQGVRNVLEGGKQWESDFTLGQWGATRGVRSRCPWLWRVPPGEGTGKGGGVLKRVGEAAGGQVPRHNGEKPLNAGTWQRSSGLFFERKKMKIAALDLSILE